VVFHEVRKVELIVVDQCQIIESAFPKQSSAADAAAAQHCHIQTLERRKELFKSLSAYSVKKIRDEFQFL